MSKSNIKDIRGIKFGRLEPFELSYLDDKKQAFWKCYCDCDNGKPKEERKVHIKMAKYLLSGDTKSCGCLKKEHLKIVRNTEKEGNVREHTKKEDYTKPFYKDLRNNWNTLINRCHNKNYKGYKNYGAKGIYLCDEWRYDFYTFYNWSIENGYQKGYTLDRLGNNYNPESCEWVDKSTNCGSTKNGTQITIRKKTQTAAAWAKETACEVTASTILDRYKKGIRGTKLLKKRQRLKDKSIEIDGQIRTLGEWATIVDISLKAFVTRWRRGNKGKDLLKPAIKRDKSKNENSTLKSVS